MSHFCNIRQGQSGATESQINHLAVSFINTAGGVVGLTDYLVAAQSSPNNTVQIAAGRAYVPNSTNTMVYSTYLDTTQNVTIAANGSGNARIDSVVLYIDLAASPDATASNVAKFFDVQGTPSGSPTAPSGAQILTAIGASNPYIILCNVAVANGFTTIVAGNLTDQRVFTSFKVGQTIPVALYEDFTDQGAAPASPISGITRLFSLASALFSKNPAGGKTQVGNNTFLAYGSSGASPSIDWSQGNNQSVTLNANATITFTNPVAGGHYTLYVIQDATGSRTITWPATVRWSNGVTPTLTTAASQVDIFGFIYTGSVFSGVSSQNYAP